jgi:hypothetical protein
MLPLPLNTTSPVSPPPLLNFAPRTGLFKLSNCNNETDKGASGYRFPWIGLFTFGNCNPVAERWFQTRHHRNAVLKLFTVVFKVQPGAYSFMVLEKRNARDWLEWYSERG